MNSDIEKVTKVKAAMLSLQRFQWEQGVAAQAIMEYDGLTDDVMRFCESVVLRSAKDGRVGVMEKNESVDDPAAIGEALIRSAKAANNKKWKEASDKLYFYLKYRAPKTKDGILFHFNIKNQVWVDAYYMAPPFFCFYGDAAEAIKQIEGFRKYLYDEKEHLLSHIWDDDLGRLERPDFWGVGNGWALAGLIRVLTMLDDSRKEDKKYILEYLKDILDGCLKYQREDGLFHDVLNNPTSFVDTNVSQMVAYTIYRGVKAGYFNKSYLKKADMARAAAYAKVDDMGFVRDVCGMPDFLRPGIATEGQAFFILMEAAARDYYEK
jgi:rhamnogalacturonyl hydrolase YesR